MQIDHSLARSSVSLCSLCGQGLFNKVLLLKWFTFRISLNAELVDSQAHSVAVQNVHTPAIGVMTAASNGRVQPPTVTAGRSASAWHWPQVPIRIGTLC